MGTTKLEDVRCRTCGKLLLKGTLGLGIIEVKCARCGTINLFHSLDDLLRGKPESYILVFDTDGQIVAVSHSAEKALGYSAEEFSKLHMSAINPAFRQPAAELLSNYDIGENEKPGSLLGKRTHEIIHLKKDGGKRAVTARYYPFGSFSGDHTMVILSPHDIKA